VSSEGSSAKRASVTARTAGDDIEPDDAGSSFLIFWGVVNGRKSVLNMFCAMFDRQRDKQMSESAGLGPAQLLLLSSNLK